MTPNSQVINNQPQLFTGVQGDSYIGFNSIIQDATITATENQGQTGFLRDNMTSLYWQSTTGDNQVEFTLAAPSTINWAGIAGGDWFSAQCTIEVYVNSLATKVAEIVGLRDGQPFMWVFDDQIVVTSVIFRFIHNGNLKVGELGFGQAIQFPCFPDVGLTLAKFNNDDVEYGKVTEDQIFAATSLLKRARTTRANYSIVAVSWVRDFWINFVDTQRGKLVWFLWDAVGHPQDISFGQWSTNAVGYTRSTHSSINFNVSGDSR